MARLQGQKNISNIGFKKIFLSATKESKIDKIGTYNNVVLIGLMKN